MPNCQQTPAAEEHFADRLVSAVRQRGTPVVVGLDPRYAQLPEPLQKASAGDTRGMAGACLEFCRGVIDVVAPLVAAIKPQAAFFELLGPWGMQGLADLIGYARSKRLLVILDGKRNDIGPTAEAYAEAYLGPAQSPWGADALTVNPGGGAFQDLIADGCAVYRHVGQHVEQLATETAGDSGYGAVGAVVGATYPEQMSALRAEMPHTWFLVPGYGSQGAAAADVAGAFDENGLGAVVNNARAIIFAHARREFAQFGAARWQQAVEAATRQMIAELAAGTRAGRLTAASSISAKA